MLNPSPDIISRLIADRRREERHRRSRKAGPLSGRIPRPVARPYAGGAAAGLDRRGVGDSQDRQRDLDRRSCRRAATPAWSAAGSRTTARSCCRCNRLDTIREVDPVSNTITVEVRRHAPAHPRGGGRGGPALSAASAFGRHLHHRRQSLHQRRRHRRARARRGALACAGSRSGAGRRAHPQQPQQAQEGQHRLRPEEPVHRRGGHARHHHRGGAAAGAAPAVGGDGLGGGARPCRPPWTFSGSATEQAAGTRHQLRADVARGHRHRDPARARHARSAFDALALVRSDRTVLAAQRGPAREPWSRSSPTGSNAASCSTPRIAESLEQAKAFWRIRELFGEVQRHEGGSIKHDVSVPVANIPAFIEEANAAAVKLIPGARPLPFGHVGDGNIHYNVSAAGRRRPRRRISSDGTT